MEKAKIIIRFKSEKVYNLTAFLVIREFKKVFEQELTKEEKQVEKALFRAGDLKKKLSDFLRFMKDMEQAIKEGRVNVFFEQDGKKTITFDMEGSKEEIDEWTKIKWNQKLALKTYLKPIMSVEVVRDA